ncbi:protein AE7 [Trifolium repens]|nr:protein AE7 [Trifolium repens]
MSELTPEPDSTVVESKKKILSLAGSPGADTSKGRFIVDNPLHHLATIIAGAAHPATVVAHRHRTTNYHQSSNRISKMVSGLINANPIIYEKKQRQQRSTQSLPGDEYTVEPIDQLEVFDILFLISISVSLSLSLDLGLFG